MIVKIIYALSFIIVSIYSGLLYLTYNIEKMIRDHRWKFQLNVV